MIRVFCIIGKRGNLWVVATSDSRGELRSIVTPRKAHKMLRTLGWV